MTPLRQRMLDDMRLRNFSPCTQKAYLLAVQKFARHFGRSPEKIDRAEIRQYLIHLIHERKVAWSTYNITRCGLRFLYEVTLGQAGVLQGLPCPKEPKRLPVVLTFDEVAKFFDACENPKYLTIFVCAYAGGLRVSEVVKLQIRDIDSQRMVLHIRQGKGWRDRYVPLSPRLLEVLRAHWRRYKPADCLFAGQPKTQPITAGSVIRYCRQVSAAAGLGKRVTMHSLRHSYATHLLEAGTRWRGRALRPSVVWMATDKALALHGGPRRRSLPNPLQTSHDLGVAQVWLHLHHAAPAWAEAWRGEDLLAHTRVGEKCPDAFVVNATEQVVLVIEFGGRYDAARIEAFHGDCAQRELPYQLW